MPKVSNHEKSKNLDLAFDETLNNLSNYVRKRKKNSKKEKKCKCKFECECAKCVVAAFEQCKAPEIDKLINTVYTPIPNFNENIVPISLNNTTSANPFTLPDINYYVSLPCDKECGEIRLLWPLVWMIPEIAKRLNIFTLTTILGPGGQVLPGFVKIRFVLNILSKRLVKNPAQIIPILNTGRIESGPHICNSVNIIQFDYDFLFRFGPSNRTVVGVFPAILDGLSIVNLSAPNNPIVETFSIDPENNFALSLDIPVDPILNAFLQFIENQFPNSPFLPTKLIVGSLPVFSPAHYISFVPSCENDCEKYWISTNIETTRV